MLNLVTLACFATLSVTSVPLFTTTFALHRSFNFGLFFTAPFFGIIRLILRREVIK